MRRIGVTLGHEESRNRFELRRLYPTIATNKRGAAVQSTETDQKTRPNVHALIQEVITSTFRDRYTAKEAKSLAMELAAALVAERDRADRAEAALASLIPVLEMTQGTAHTLLRGVLIGGVYSPEATPNQNRQKQDTTKWALEQAQANLSQLRRQVADAPHAYSCLSSFAIRGDGCTCWKSEATA